MTTLTDHELATVLAGLRLIQIMGIPANLEEVATDCGRFPLMGETEIDALVQRLNNGHTDGRHVFDVLDTATGARAGGKFKFWPVDFAGEDICRAGATAEAERLNAEAPGRYTVRETGRPGTSAEKGA